MTRPAPGTPTASFAARLAGLLLDVVLHGAPAAAVAVPVVLLTHPGALRVALLVAGCVPAAALNLTLLGRTGQTWGRRLAGVRVVARATGQPLGVGRALARTVAELLLSANCLIGYLWMLWDPAHQTWHDKVADSLVVPVGGRKDGAARTLR